jgi:hypothetical protein
MSAGAGVDVRIQVRNNGQPCRFRVAFNAWGIPREGDIYDALRVDTRPSNGTVLTPNPNILYTPRPGFTGRDFFVVLSEPWGRLAVTVDVVAP